MTNIMTCVSTDVANIGNMCNDYSTNCVQTNKCPVGLKHFHFPEDSAFSNLFNKLYLKTKIIV